MSDNIKLTNIDDYLIHHKQNKELLQQIRHLIKSTVPEAEERILWSTPWYYLYRKPFVWLADNTNHISFGFSQGASLQSDLLEGTGKNMRHIKLQKSEGLENKKDEIVQLMHQATLLPQKVSK